MKITLSLLTVKVLVTQSCPTLCDPMDCSPPGSSVHGIHQAGILEWVAIPFSRGSSQSRDQTQVSYTAGWFFTIIAKFLCITSLQGHLCEFLFHAPNLPLRPLRELNHSEELITQGESSSGLLPGMGGRPKLPAALATSLHSLLSFCFLL